MTTPKHPEKWGCCNYNGNEECWPVNGTCSEGRFGRVNIGHFPVDRCRVCK